MCIPSTLKKMVIVVAAISLTHPCYADEAPQELGDAGTSVSDEELKGLDSELRSVRAWLKSEGATPPLFTRLRVRELSDTLEKLPMGHKQRVEAASIAAIYSRRRIAEGSPQDKRPSTDIQIRHAQDRVLTAWTFLMALGLLAPDRSLENVVAFLGDPDEVRGNRYSWYFETASAKNPQLIVCFREDGKSTDVIARWSSPRDSDF